MPAIRFSPRKVVQIAVPLPQPLKTDLLILQPTGFCNLDCDYCYLPGRNSTKIMRPHTAQRALQWLDDEGLLGDALSVVWHAGEPLVVGLPFYREVLQLFGESTPPGVRVTHHFQTNATLVDDAWATFFSENHCSIGVSIDGPPRLHDLHRKYRSGRGSYGHALDGIAALKARGVPFHIIAVITADTLALGAEEYLSHFVELGSTELCFNIDEQEGLYSRSTLHGKIEEYHVFINELRSAQKSSPVPISIREFDSAAAKILTPPATYQLGGKSLPFNSLVVPFSIFSVAVDGSFSTFSPELLSQREKNGFKFGNVWSDGLQDAICNPNFREAYAEILSGIGSCLKSCRYFEWCGGGAPSNKLYENGSFNSTETNYCKMTFQIPFDLVLGELEHYLEERSAHM